MKDLQEIFYEKILLLQKLSTDFNLKACSTTSTDLITSSILFEYTDGAFIGEVFEGVFEQLNDLMKSFSLDDKDKEILKKSFEKNLGIIAESFKKKDKNELYQALANLRYDATKMQYKCYQTRNRAKKERVISFPDFR